MKCEEVKKYIVGYLDGELDRKTYETVRTHLETCEKCRKEISKVRTIGELTKNVNRIQTSESFGENLRKRIDEYNKKRKSDKMAIVRILIAAAVVALIASFFIFFRSIPIRKAAEPVWKITENLYVSIKGPKDIYWRKKAINEAIEYGNSVMTERNQYYTVRTADGSILEIAPDSIIMINHAEGEYRLHVLIEKGSVYFIVPEDSKKIRITAAECDIYAYGGEVYIERISNASVITSVKGSVSVINKQGSIVPGEGSQIYAAYEKKPEYIKDSYVKAAVMRAMLYKPIEFIYYSSLVENEMLSCGAMLDSLSMYMKIPVVRHDEKELDKVNCGSAVKETHSQCMMSILTLLEAVHGIKFRISAEGIDVFYGPSAEKTAGYDRTIPHEYDELIKQYYKRIGRQKK